MAFAPPTPPEPLTYPPQHFLATAITVDYFDDYVTITLTTTTICKLALLYTPIAPDVSTRGCSKRGKPDFRDARIAFYPNGWIQQEEADETLVHTFQLSRDDYGGPLWFRFELLYPGYLASPVSGSTNIVYSTEWRDIGGYWTKVLLAYCPVDAWTGSVIDLVRLWAPKSCTPFFYITLPWPWWAQLLTEPWYDATLYTWIHTDEWTLPPFEGELKFLEGWPS